MAVKVLVVDDSGFFRRRVSEILSADVNIQVVGTATNGKEAIDQALALKPDVITMDYEMPMMDGITAVRHIMQRCPTPVLMFSSLTHEGARVTLHALDAGAVDFLPRPFDEGDLLGAIDYALEIDTERRSANRTRHALTQRFDRLTPRERQVMEGVVRGLMNKQIAWELEISEITVKLHRSSLMRKMELRSVADLVRASFSLSVH